MTRLDPHEGKTSGQGCGCTLCLRSILQSDGSNRLEGLIRSNNYAEQRRVWREEHGLPTKCGRGVGSSTMTVEPVPFPASRSVA